MPATEALPRTFPVADFATGDRFAFPTRPDSVYEIVEILPATNDLTAFTATPVEGLGGSSLCTFTFPQDMPVVARRRARFYRVPCMLCKTRVETAVDTAYYGLLNVLCGKH